MSGSVYGSPLPCSCSVESPPGCGSRMTTVAAPTAWSSAPPYTASTAIPLPCSCSVQPAERGPRHHLDAVVPVGGARAVGPHLARLDARARAWLELERRRRRRVPAARRGEQHGEERRRAAWWLRAGMVRSVPSLASRSPDLRRSRPTSRFLASRFCGPCRDWQGAGEFASFAANVSPRLRLARGAAAGPRRPGRGGDTAAHTSAAAARRRSTTASAFRYPGGGRSPRRRHLLHHRRRRHRRLRRPTCPRERVARLFVPIHGGGQHAQACPGRAGCDGMSSGVFRPPEISSRSSGTSRPTTPR